MASLSFPNQCEREFEDSVAASGEIVDRLFDVILRKPAVAESVRLILDSNGRFHGNVDVELRLRERGTNVAASGPTLDTSSGLFADECRAPVELRACSFSLYGRTVRGPARGI